MQKILKVVGLVLLLAILGCATVSSPGPQGTDASKTEFDCQDPKGREYYCYNDDECVEYMKGYAQLLNHRIFMQKKHGWYKGVKTHTTYINLWMDHLSMLMIGTLSITPNGKGRTIEMSTEIYDLDCNFTFKDHKKETAGEKI